MKVVRLHHELIDDEDSDNGIPTHAKLIELSLDWLIDEVKR